MEDKLIRLTVVALCCFLTIFLSASVAMCDDSGFYFSVYGGAVQLDESNNEDGTGSYIMSHEPGLAGGTTIGYRLGERFPYIGKGRMEIELSYRNNDLEEIEFSTGKFEASGNISSITALANTIAEYKENPQHTPYIGVGLGVAEISMNDAMVDGDKVADDTDIVLAYQILLGTTLPLSNKLVFDIGYRLMGTSEPEFVDNRDRLFTSEYISHTLGLGIRVDF